MKGWKTWLAAMIIMGCAGAVYMGWIDEHTQKLIIEAGAALGLIGLGHKIDKSRVF